MFEKKELISGIDGSKYTKYFYTFNKSDKIVGILFGHFAPFTGPNGHGRMITALKKLGAEKFLIATPQNNKPFDDEREMFNADQRAEIINQYLNEQGLEGKAIAYKMKRGGAKSQMGPLVAKAAELFGLDIRPVFCFGPDREDLASEVCNKFGDIKDPNHCEYIVDYDRGTSGTKVRELIKKGDVDGIVKETGYDKSIAEMLINLRNENLKKSKFDEGIRGKVELDFASIYEANKFKQEMERRFKKDKNVFISSNFNLPNKSSLWNESLEKYEQAYWYYKGEFFPIDEDDFHFSEVLRCYESFGIKDDELEKIFSESDLSFKEFKDNPEAAITYLSNIYAVGDDEDYKVLDLADKVLILAHSKGALRVRPLPDVTYITCSSIKKKSVRNEILNMLMEDGKLNKNKAFIIESVDDDEWAHDLHAFNLVDLMNKIVEL